MTPALRRSFTSIVFCISFASTGIAQELAARVANLETFNASLEHALSAYRVDLEKAFETYGRGFDDSQSGRKLKGFDDDIRTGNAGQTSRIRLGIFATILMTSGVHLDPDPLRDWADVERNLSEYTAATHIDAALLRTHDLSLSPRALQELNSRWQTAVERARKERDLAENLRPAKLERWQTYSAQAIEGPNLEFSFFGLQLGRELGNVSALFQLTYGGRTAHSQVFLLTAISAEHSKARTDTSIGSRSLAVFDQSGETPRYGHVVTMQDHGFYREAGALVADVAGKSQDWAWKELGEGEPAQVCTLDHAIEAIHQDVVALRAAMKDLDSLAAQAVRENDRLLLSEEGGKARIPEQDLRSFPDLRARLFLTRALYSRDRRFVAMEERIQSAQSQAEASVRAAQSLVAQFNALADFDAPSLPWTRIQKLARDFMRAAAEERRALADSASALPTLGPNAGSQVVATPELIVEQTIRESGAKDSPTVFEERILRDVHWAVKGIPRKEYSAELIVTERGTGLQRVQRAAGPQYIQGPGGIQQIFKKLSRPAL
jgi:hypothetical protein